MDNAAYFQKLIGTVTRIARHSFYPGKEEAVELCLEEIEELRDSGRIDAEQLARLRELLLGEETFCMLEGAIREREHPERIPSQDRIALVCQGTGSHAAFTAGVLQGLLEQAGGDGQIAALAGTSFGALRTAGLGRLAPGRATAGGRSARRVLARLCGRLAGRRSSQLLGPDGASPPRDGTATGSRPPRGHRAGPGPAPQIARTPGGFRRGSFASRTAGGTGTGGRHRRRPRESSGSAAARR